LREYLTIAISFIVVIFALYSSNKVSYGLGLLAFCFFSLYINLTNGHEFDIQEFYSLMLFDGETMWEVRLFPSIIGVVPAATLFLTWRLINFLTKLKD